MSKLKLLPVTEQKKHIFIKEIQEAFQTGYESEYDPSSEIIFPENDIEESFTAKGSKS
jgi:hypothetical protein